jgi:competence protein ComEC
LDYIWQITTVSFAAQLATFPISAYYFHVFPTYFAIANLVAIPGAFLMMAFGVPFMVLVKVPYVSLALGCITEKIIVLVNSMIFWFQELPGSRVSEIYFSVGFIWVYWLVLAVGVLLWLYPGRRLAYTLVTLLLLIGIFRMVSAFIPNKKNEIILYAAGKGFAIDYQFGENLFWFDQASDQAISYKVMPNRNAAGAKSRFPLVAFDSKDGAEIPFPRKMESLIIQKNVLHLPEGMDDFSMYKWNEDKWEALPKTDSIPLGGHSYKLIFN